MKGKQTAYIYIKPMCPYSINAVRLANERNFHTVVYDISKFGNDISTVVKTLQKAGYNMPNQRTVPIVFVQNGKEKSKHIGGFTEFNAHCNKMLQ